MIDRLIKEKRMTDYFTTRTHYTIEQAADLLSTMPSHLRRLCHEERVYSDSTDKDRFIPIYEVDRILKERAEMKATLAEARRNRKTVEEEIIEGLGLDDETARILGLVSTEKQPTKEK